MSRLIDNLIAYRVLSMLVTSFVDTKAYKLGIIDATGKNLRKSYTLKTTEEKEAYTYLNRLVFNMKKIINKLPGGETKLKSLVAAFFLVKEYYEHGDRTTSLMEEKYIRLLEKMNSGISLVEEEIIVSRFLSEEMVANSTGAAVATDTATVLKKDAKKYKNISRRKSLVKV